jgi:hypothetical protein
MTVFDKLAKDGIISKANLNKYFDLKPDTVLLP